MKRYFHISHLLILLVCFSCSTSGTDDIFTGEPTEVEIRLTSLPVLTTRGTDFIQDEGHPDERYIQELDILIFDQYGFAYRREAYKIDESNRFRVTLAGTEETLTGYVFANCRTLLRNWEVEEDRTNLEWETVQKQLTDPDPIRLVTSPFPVYLPMWGKVTGTVSNAGNNQWGPVQMLRSVASVDLYVEQNLQTSLFTPTDLYIYYVPNQGYLAPQPDPDSPGEVIPVSPPGMNTSLLLHTDQVETISRQNNGQTNEYNAIVYQLYLYDNDVTRETANDNKRFCRMVLGGYYNQTGPVEEWEKSFYPLDFTYSDGSLRTIIRNWKYEYNISGVYGPGYNTPDEAVRNYPININTEIIDWNNNDISIDVQGNYYVTIPEKKIFLKRKAGSSGKLTITYLIYDDIPGESFISYFANNDNGTQEITDDGIRNDYFKVTLIHDPEGKSAEVEVTALQTYTPGHSLDTLIVQFREIKIYIEITQQDQDSDDWEWGGNQEEIL